ncbi:MAG: glutaminase A [Gammaproteobacteria bacterium]|nr:glutaminase A [Gammaproteobacteria bacterium]MBU2056652.1 glutaminase A [Gammaproteobacteria bacterium]MBU2173989.1 glutaminase A [Gammaproteobacteria bacterium]MBU2247295.1 glutaminase A [Gammaproteobacteria bacterium]MBU2343947.1 glutaminase A [Gammaproteobacteria bacterium]
MKQTDVNPLFRSLDEQGEGMVSKAAILARLTQSGIATNDSRLPGVLSVLESIKGNKVSKEGFDALLSYGGTLFERAITGQLVIPEFTQFSQEVQQIFNTVLDNREGKVADYIPQLGRVPADKFGVAICTIDGQRFCLGDVDDAFTLQSSCKPILYCAALEEHGEEKVHRHVGREPSGLSFNELTLNRIGLPHNPMINAGAIMSSSLMRRDLPTADRLEYLNSIVKALSGDRQPGFNNAVFQSERETADRNFALAHHMRERGAFPEGIEINSTLDYYFAACSTEVTANNMSTISATLANGGVCPQTGQRVFTKETIKNCLSMMYSCGMYDYSGEFAFKVGIPAKSSVSGVIMAVIPNVLGIAVWSPRLDACGNSVRGVDFLTKLVERFCFHNYDSLVESKKLDPRRVRNERESNLIYQAIYAASIGDVNELKRLVAHEHDLNSADYDGRTPLHLAAAEGQAEAVGYLLKQKVQHNPLDRWGFTPLDDAIRHKQQAVIQLLDGDKDGPKKVA